jgi:hypothetical protein
MFLVAAIFKVKKDGVQLPFLGLVGIGSFGKTLFRLCMAVHILVQLASGFRSSIDGWFEAAHAAARDDRYLIGELLLNYNAEGDNTS